MTEEKKVTKPVCVVNDQGATVMAMNSMRREGDKILANGILMGSWPSNMYVGPEDLWKMIVMIIKHPSVIGYVLSLPYLLLRKKMTIGKKAKAKG